MLQHVDAPAIAAFLRMDEFLGTLRDGLDADFVVVSDHGWSFTGYLHYGSPDGIVLFSGPSFRSGLNLTDVGIEDIAPTVLAALGVPLSRELVGRVVSEAFETPPATAAVEGYGAPVHFGTEAARGDDAELERLRALGYVQ